MMLQEVYIHTDIHVHTHIYTHVTRSSTMVMNTVVSAILWRYKLEPVTRPKEVLKAEIAPEIPFVLDFVIEISSKKIKLLILK